MSKSTETRIANSSNHKTTTNNNCLYKSESRVEQSPSSIEPDHSDVNKYHQHYTFEEWMELTGSVKIDSKTWNHFAGRSFDDPHTLMLKSIFDMLRHIMFKLANSKLDVNEAAYAEKGFELAMSQVEDMGWKMSNIPKPDIAQND